MKTSQFAAAAIAVCGGAAMAQSSVTLYGVADAGAARTQQIVTNPDGSTHRKSTNGMSSGGLMSNTNSRVGLRGVEDLGGGLKVGFNFEDGLSLKDGASGLSGGQFWSRQANVWIGGPWGQLVLGRGFNPSYDALSAWELSGRANYSVIANTYGYTGEGSRTSSQFKYVTPNLGGLKAEASYVARDDNRGSGKPRSKWDVGVIYAHGPIGVGASANKQSGAKTNYEVGGKYTFGSAGGGRFLVAASYHGINTPDFTAGTNARRRGFSLGGSYLRGPFTVTLDLTRDTRNDLAANARKHTNALLEGRYALSKRTFVYAAYLRFDRTNNYGIGLDHKF